MNLDVKIFHMINNLAYRNSVVDKIMVAFSTYVPYLFMASVAGLFLYGVIKGKSELRGEAVDIGVVTVLLLGISFLIGLVHYVPRPFVTEKVNLLAAHVADASFPSDHAIGTMTIALGISRFKKSWGRAAVILSGIVGFSRVYVGHHFPSDVLGGFILAFGVSLLYTKIIGRKVKDLYIGLENSAINMLNLKKQFENK